MWPTAAARRVAALALISALGTSCSIGSAAGTDTTSTAAASSTSLPATTSTTDQSTTSTTATTTTVAATTTTTTAPPIDTGPAFAAIDTAAQSLLSSSGDLAVSVAVARNGVVVHQAAVSRANDGWDGPITSATRFRLASVSKVLTSIVIMQLVEEGSLELDRPFVDYLKSVAAPIDPRVSRITIRQLLSHSSGLGPDRNAYFGGGSSSWRDSALLAFRTSLLAEPGTEFRYSNTNYCILGLVIEQITGQTYEQAVIERVAESQAISGIRLADTVDSGPGDAPYRSSVGRTYMEALGPAGAWIASAPDVALIYNSLVVAGAGRHPLSAESVALMRTPVPFATPGASWTYGYGMMLFGESWGHTGTIEHARTAVLTVPNGYTISILVSGATPATGEGLMADFGSAIMQIAALG